MNRAILRRRLGQVVEPDPVLDALDTMSWEKPNECQVPGIRRRRDTVAEKLVIDRQGWRG